jgi:hypothetical protein
LENKYNNYANDVSGLIDNNCGSGSIDNNKGSVVEVTYTGDPITMVVDNIDASINSSLLGTVFQFIFKSILSIYCVSI